MPRSIQLVRAQHGIHIGLLRHVDEGQRAEVVADERDVGRQPRHALVHVLKGLQVGQVHHQREGLLARVGDLCRQLLLRGDAWYGRGCAEERQDCDSLIVVNQLMRQMMCRTNADQGVQLRYTVVDLRGEAS